MIQVYSGEFNKGSSRTATYSASDLSDLGQTILFLHSSICQSMSLSQFIYKMGILFQSSNTYQIVIYIKQNAHKYIPSLPAYRNPINIRYNYEISKMTY